MIKDRVDIKDFILKIERDFSVNNWKINDIHIWPYLRIKLFFYLIDKIEVQERISSQNKKTKDNKFFKAITSRLNKVFSIGYYFFWKNSLPKKERLFVSSDSHRVNFKGKRFNRYFDVLIEKNNWFPDSIYFEYDSNLENQFNSQLVYKYTKALLGYLQINSKKERVEVSLEEYQKFIVFLKENALTKPFADKFSKEKIISWTEKRFLLKIDFFKSVLKKIEPKEIYILCYYSEDILALTVAANQLKIKTIEMQHGPQTDIHLCYGSWSNVSHEGYDMLPRNFWCWDEYSQSVLESWVSNNNQYATILGGNPWVDYWKGNAEVYPYNGYVLYSLQPNPVTLEQSFSPQMIELIKESKVDWFIRLHPRQIKELSMIKSFLRDKEILNLINIENATYDPLPQLLVNAKIHITHYSGTALEASYFGLKTIILNNKGLQSFPHLFKNEMAKFIDYKDADFLKKMQVELNQIQ